MQSERAAVISALIQSTPLAALHGIGSVVSSASLDLENDIVHMIEWGQSSHNNAMGMQWPKG